LVLLLKDRAVAVIDEFELPFAGLVESRLHTFSKVRFRARSAEIRGEKNTLGVVPASTEPAQLQRGLGLPTHPPRRPDIILRHQSKAKIQRAALCWLLVPNGSGTVEVEENAATRKFSFMWEDAQGRARMELEIEPHLALRE